MLFIPRMLGSVAARAAAPAGGSPDPTTIVGADLVAWFDAQDNATLTGTPVTTWSDKSGNANHITAPTGTGKNAVGISSKQSLTFTGISAEEFLNAAVTIGTTDKLALFVVVKPNTGGSVFDRRIGAWADGSHADYEFAANATLIDTTGTDLSFGAYRNGAVKSQQAASFVNGTVYRVASVYDGTNHTIYVDNIAETPVASTGNFANPGILAIGGGIDSSGARAGNWFKGEIGEVVLVKGSGATDATIRNNLNTYFMGRW